jgi:serine/threonine protein kinase
VPLLDIVVDRDQTSKFIFRRQHDMKSQGDLRLLLGDLKTFLVFPYMDHDLCGLLKNPNLNITDSLIKLYLLQLLEGVAYMHHVSCRLSTVAKTRRIYTGVPRQEQHRSPRFEVRKYPPE